MIISLLGSLAGALLGWLMGFLSLFLIMLILIQRGKGGGLTGALGGPGGQSAFGSKAGDTFTVITVVVASIWGFTCAFTMWLLGTHTPTTVTETNISAGPGDDQGMGTEPIVPPAAGGGFGDFGGVGGLSAGDESAAPAETPSMDLIPKNGEVPPDASDSADPEKTDTGAPDSTDAPDSTGAPDPTDAPKADAPETDAPETGAPDPTDAPDANVPKADAGEGDSGAESTSDRE